MIWPWNGLPSRSDSNVIAVTASPSSITSKRFGSSVSDMKSTRKVEVVLLGPTRLLRVGNASLPKPSLWVHLHGAATCTSAGSLGWAPSCFRETSVTSAVRLSLSDNPSRCRRAALALSFVSSAARSDYICSMSGFVSNFHRWRGVSSILLQFRDVGCLGYPQCRKTRFRALSRLCEPADARQCEG